MADRIQLSTSTKEEWEEFNPVLRDGEAGIVKGTTKIKIGDGVTAWKDLAYALDYIRHLKIIEDTTLESNDYALVDTSIKSITLTLPTITADGMLVYITDISNNANINNIKLLRNGATIQELAEDLSIDINNANVKLISVGTDWRLLWVI